MALWKKMGNAWPGVALVAHRAVRLAAGAVALGCRSGACAAAWLLTAVGLLFPSAAALAGEPAPVAVPPEVQAILSQPSESSLYPEEQRCLPLHRIRSVTALDERHVVFRMGRREYYLVQFQHRCPGLRRNDPVAYETLNGMSVCSHDTMRGLLRYGIGDNRLGPPCAIPGFQQLSQEQLDALKSALQAKN